MSKAGFFFYTGDWIKDTRCLTPECRGCWIDLLCLLIERDGSVTMPLHAFDQYWGMTDNGDISYSAAEILAELSDTKTAEVTHEKRENAHYVTVVSRRITRDVKLREDNKNRQRKRRKKQPVTDVSQQNTGALPSPSLNPSPSPSPSLVRNKTRISASPGLSNLEKKKEESPMASMNLIPELKAAADAVYYSDPKKFRNLAKWIGQGRKHGWSEEAMAETLREFKAGGWHLVEDWYAYLDSMLKRIDKDLNRDASDEEAKQHKEELRELSKNFR